VNGKRILIFLLFMTLGLSFMPALSGCGGVGSPPASIPAPVSQLIALSPPGPTGAVGITGDVGSVEPGATVQARNVTQAGPFTRLLNWLIRKAYAQIFEDSTVADDEGAFFLLIDAESGDTIAIRQIVGGEVSPETDKIVP